MLGHPSFTSSALQAPSPGKEKENTMNRIINNFTRKEVRKELRKNETPEEKILWEKLRDNQTSFKWRRQVSIGPYIADFYCRSKLLIIELDGSQHIENKKYDEERNKYFENLGIRTIRFWNSEINKNLKEVLEKINSELQKELGNPEFFPSHFQERGYPVGDCTQSGGEVYRT